jgi:hypothetical protein
MDIHDVTVDDVDDESAAADLAEPDIEAPEADLVEQHQIVGPDRSQFDLDHLPLDANEADVAEQNLVVPEDEDDYR